MNYSEKELVRQKARNSIKNVEKCEKCDGKDNLERHHLDYKKPLSVNILCSKCHKKLHNNNKELKISKGRKLIITFAGNKEALHKQLKAWTVEAETSMNGTIVSLIENHLKNSAKGK